MGNKKLSLSAVLNLRAIRNMADERSFSRGEEYQESGQVQSIAEHGDMIIAEVSGTQDYRVKLWAKGGRLDYSCDCPVGSEGDFCKHCVAAGLERLARPAAEPKPRAGKSPVTISDVQEFLAKQEKSTLIDLLMKQTLADDQLLERLFMKAAKQNRKKLSDRRKST